MKARVLCAFALCAVGACVSAQTPAAFVGTWKVTWQGEKRPQEARLVLSETGGTWKTATSSQSNSCIGREVSVVVESASDTDAQLRLKFSELAGCADSTVTIRKLDAQHMAGTRGKAELTLVRE